MSGIVIHAISSCLGEIGFDFIYDSVPLGCNLQLGQGSTELDNVQHGNLSALARAVVSLVSRILGFCSPWHFTVFA